MGSTFDHGLKNLAPWLTADQMSPTWNPSSATSSVNLKSASWGAWNGAKTLSRKDRSYSGSR